MRSTHDRRVSISMFVLLMQFLALLCLAVPCTAGAAELDLSTAVDRTLLADPSLKAAAAQRDATLEQRVQGIAQVLPQLSFQQTKNNNATDQSTAVGSTQGILQHFEYPSESKAVILRQPVVRPRQVFNALQGSAKARLGEAQFESVRQKTIGRAAGAYLTYLAKYENLQASRAELEAAEIRVRQGEMLHRAGEISEVEFTAARSALALARARLMEASSSFATVRRDLAAMTSIQVPEQTGEPAWTAAAERILAQLRQNPLSNEEVDLSRNPEVLAQELAVEVTGLEVKKAASDHAPTVDFVASISEGNSAQDIAINQYTKTRSIGLQLNVPIFAGGATQSVVRETMAMREKALYDLNATRLRIDNDRSRFSEEVVYRLDLIEAGLAELKSAEASLRQAELGLKGGITSESDIAERRAKRLRALAGLAGYVTDVVGTYVGHLASLGVLEADLVRPLSAALAAQ